MWLFIADFLWMSVQIIWYCITWESFTCGWIKCMVPNILCKVLKIWFLQTISSLDSCPWLRNKVSHEFTNLKGHKLTSTRSLTHGVQLIIKKISMRRVVRLYLWTLRVMLRFSRYITGLLEQWLRRQN